MDVSLDRGAGYGDTLIWSDRVKPALDVQLVHAQMNVNMPKFAETFVKLMTAPTPGAHDPLMLKEPPPPDAAPGRPQSLRAIARGPSRRMKHLLNSPDTLSQCAASCCWLFSPSWPAPTTPSC